MTARAALGAVTLLVLCVADAGASRIAGAPTDFKDLLVNYDAVFIGYVDSVRSERWRGDQPCARGLGPENAIRWVVRVEEVLQGSGLHGREVILGFEGTPDATPGKRVLAFGNRDCSWDWNLWGYAIVLEGDTLRTDNSYFEGDSEAPTIRRPRASLWSTLRPLRERPLGQSAAVFDEFDGLGIFQATSGLKRSEDGFEVSGRWIGALRGEAPADTVLLRFDPAPGWGAPISPGDTLIVPWRGRSAGPVLTFQVSPRRFKVKDGIAISFGRSLDALPATILQRRNRWRIPPVAYP